MSAPDLHHLTRLVYESVVEPGKWNQAMSAIADTFDAGHVLVGMRRIGEEPEYLSARVDELHLRAFWHKLDESEFRDFPSMMPIGKFVASASTFDYRTYVRSDFFQAIVRPMGGHHALLGLPFRMQDEQCFIAVCRSDRQGLFANGALTQIQILMPHLQSAFSLQRKLSRTQRGLWHRESILDHLDVGVVLLDKRQRPLVANKKAREILGLRRDVALGREGLRSNASALTRMLQRMIGEAIQSDSLAREPLWLRVERAGSTPLLLRVVPVSESDECINAWPHAAVAVFVDTVDRAQLSPDRLRSWFGFSAREAELAVLLASGQDLASSAKAMRIGFETARTHLDKLFTKTGTSRQAELVSVLLRTAWRL